MHDLTRLIKIVHQIDKKLGSIDERLDKVTQNKREYVTPTPAVAEKSRWLKASEAAGLIQVDRKTIEAYYRSGQIERRLINGVWHYWEPDVLKFDKRTY